LSFLISNITFNLSRFSSQRHQRFDSVHQVINNLSHFTMYNRSSEQYYDQTQPPPPPYSAHAPQQGSKQPPLPYQSDDSESFGPPRRQDSFGPPVTGGFQHGYEGGQFGAYEASNPQGHMGYLYDSHPSSLCTN
jgi:hypothetical protein